MIEHLTSFALLLRGSIRRVWLPFRRLISSSTPWWFFSTANAHGLRSSELFSPAMIRKGFPHLFFRSCTFFQNLLDFKSVLQRFTPIAEPYPLLLPEVLIQGGTSCSPELLGLSGTSSTLTGLKSFPFQPPLLVLLYPPVSRPEEPGPQGFFSRAVWLSPSEEGAGLFGLFHRSHRLPPFRKMNLPRTIFSSQRAWPSHKSKAPCLSGRCSSA